MSDLLPSPVWPPTAPPEDGRLGTATIEPPTPVVAGEFGTWTLTYTAGKFGIDDAGALRLVFHTTSDLGAPQLDDPAAPDYCRIVCSSPPPRRIEARYDGELGVRPWKRTIHMRIRDQAVRPGDTITVTIGDRLGGSPGARGQTYAGPMRFQFLADAYGTGIFLPVSQPLEVEVIAGKAHHLRVHAPSDALLGEPFDVTIAVRDHWGNVVRHWRQLAQLGEPGVQTVRIEDEESGLRGESNPIRVLAAAPEAQAPGYIEAKPAEAGSPPLADRRDDALAPFADRNGNIYARGGASAEAYCVYWGDLHAQSEETIGSGTLDQYFSHARDCAAVDFVGHQGNDFQVTEPVWRAIMAKTQEYDAANRFITFAGYEWSGNTPGGGDHNVHFRGGPGQRYDLHRSGHWQIFDRSDEATDRFPVTELYAAFRGRDDVILIPHVGGRYANLAEFFDESLMPLVEIASCWGVFEWFADDAFRRGAVFGFSAGSDDHTARPGMSHAPRGHFATGGGLTAVLARERSREAIWEAVKARRTYATTGARILLDVALTADSARHPVGSVCRSSDGMVELDVSVHGTAPLWRVEVVRWPEVVYSHPFPPPNLPPDRHRLRIAWTGAHIRARHRMQRWDGSLTVSGGRIIGAEGWGFDQPEQGIVAQDARTVRWLSETAGDWDGIVVELEGPDDAKLEFASGPATFRCTPHDVAEGPLVVDAGGVGRRVVVERDPGPDQPRAAAFAFRDEAPSGARSPYFVRVTQQDGHVAWSSPIFVSRE